MAGQAAVAMAFRTEHERRVTKSKVLLTWYAQDIGNHMRKNARWVDRTGNARASLRAVTQFTSDMLGVVLVGGGPPDYVKYLELAMAGKYAIIRPTLEAYAGRIYRDLVGIWT